MASTTDVKKQFDEYPRLQRITSEIERITAEFQRKLAVVERLNQQLSKAEVKRDLVTRQQEIEEKAQAILLKLEDIWRKDFETGIENIVTEGLNLVFGTDEAFVITTKVERGASAIEFSIETPTATVEVEDRGGARVQVVSFLLRVILIKAARPALRPVVLIDEGFNAVSEEYRPAVGALIRKIVEESGVQVIYVSQERIFIEYADICYEIQQHKGIASFHRLEISE